MTRERAQELLEKYTKLQRRYKNYPGSPWDDALLGVYGYTVREERGYINRQVKFFKKALEYMNQNGKDEITDREAFYL